MASSMDLSGKTIVITGASRGLGAGMADAYLAAGASLGLCALSGIARTEDRVVGAAVDVTDAAAMERFTGAVVDRFGAIDLWINNAGILGAIAPSRDQSAEDFQAVMSVNVTGVFIGSRAYVHHVRERGGQGILINISSGAAQKPYPGWAAYCASKAAVDMFTQVLQAEEPAIRAHSVAPGVIDTDMQAAIRACSVDDFPPVQRFLDLKANDAFNSAAHVGQELAAMAFDPGRRPDSVVARVRNQTT